MEMTRSIPEISVDARLLYQRLNKAAEGETIPYEELSNLIKRDVTGSARGVLETARRMAQRQDKSVFVCVMRVGLKRLPNAAIPETVFNSSASRIRSATRRGMKKLACTRYQELNKDQQVTFNTAMSLMSSLSHLSGQSSMRLVEERVRVSLSEIPMSETLAILAK